jgi:hypothetical protein
MNQISMVILKDNSECGDGTNSCEQLCDSRPGTYACGCHGFGGYELNSNGFACIKEKFIIILLLTLGACAKGTVVVVCKYACYHTSCYIPARPYITFFQWGGNVYIRGMHRQLIGHVTVGTNRKIDFRQW